MKRFFYILTLLFLLQSCKNAVVLDVKTFSFPKENEIVFGNGQDILFHGLPDSALIIKYKAADSSFDWTLKKPVYFQIDGITQNTVLIDSLLSVVVGDKQFDFSLFLPIVNSYRKKSDRVNYIRLYNLIRAVDTSLSVNADSLNTLVSCDGGDDARPKLILLDPGIVAIKKNGQRQAYISTGRFAGKRNTIRFFRVFNASLISKKSKLFQIGDTIFYTTIKPYFTPFGASDVTVTTNQSVDVSFNRIYRAIVPQASIARALAKNKAVDIEVRQKAHGRAYMNELSVANFSQNNSLKLGVIDSASNFIPEKGNFLLSKSDFQLKRLNRQTYFLAIVPLVLVFLFGVVIIFRMTRIDLYESESNRGESKKWSKYFLVLFTALFLLSLGRIFIGYNLSYTAPYFSFSFPTATIVSPVILLAVLFIWVIFMLIDDPDRFGLPFRLLVPGFAILLFYGLFRFAKSEFPYYLAAFKENFQVLHPAVNEVYYQTIFNLLVLIAMLSVSILLVPRSGSRLPKINRLVFSFSMILLAVVFIWFGENSYSVSALLLALLLISLLPVILPDIFEPGYEAGIGRKLKLLAFLMLPPAMAFLLAIGLKRDPGYYINLMAFPLIVSIILFRFYKFYPDTHLQIDKGKTRKQERQGLIVLVSLAVALVLISKLVSKNYDPLGAGRMKSRLTAFFDFTTMHEYGTRESEKHAQFFAGLAKYSYPCVYNSYEPILPGISSFSDPVVKNDLSVPFGLISPFGKNYWLVPLIGLLVIWLAVLYMVLRMSVTPSSNLAGQRYFTQYSLIRIYCACIIFSSGIWLLASYYNIVPFTGRLIFGLGQDSVGEVFETIILFGYMGLIGKTIHQHGKNR